MNKHISLLFAAASTLAFAACEKDTVGEHVDDATESRPAEGVQDAVEDAKEEVKDTTN